jgi:hypothetical protein
VTLVKLRHAAQVTLPQDIREAAPLEESGCLMAETIAVGVILPRTVGTAGNEPSTAEEVEILAVVDQERRAYATEHRR